VKKLVSLESGQVELDESYFDGKREGIRGRGAKGNSVFCILKLKGKVFTQIINNCSIADLVRLSRNKYLKIMWFLQMVLRVMIAWLIMVISNIFVLIIAKMSLQKVMKIYIN
jgi:hypothetical protein